VGNIDDDDDVKANLLVADDKLTVMRPWWRRIVLKFSGHLS